MIIYNIVISDDKGHNWVIENVPIFIIVISIILIFICSIFYHWGYNANQNKNQKSLTNKKDNNLLKNQGLNDKYIYLERLKQLYDSEAITKEEYELEKRKILEN